MKRIKYLKRRGDWYHFERVMPTDVAGIIGKKAPREALGTGSKVEAEGRCRLRTVEAESEIRQARGGTYRNLSPIEIEDIAVQRSIDFQQIDWENIARDAFLDVWAEQDRIGDEAPNPIFRSKPDKTIPAMTTTLPRIV